MSDIVSLVGKVKLNAPMSMIFIGVKTWFIRYRVGHQGYFDQ